MNHKTKKFVSLSITLALVAAFSMLTGCSDKETEQAQARQKAQYEAQKQFMSQGNGKVRDWGTSGFVGFGTSKDKPAGTAKPANNH
jgi:outer membrane biogenesis lipoprotein LolB